MVEVKLDAASWKSKDDFYDSFFKAVKAPLWHGRNFNALNDSIGTGSINEIELPYLIKITNTGSLSTELLKLISDFKDLIGALKSEGCEVEIVIEK